MQIPVLNGIYTDGASDFRTSYPRNLIPVPKEQGISKGYLRPADGIAYHGQGPGIGRGGINWKGVCYRVMGTKLVKIGDAGAVTEIGDVGGTGQVSLDFSFDRLAIASGGKLFYYDGVGLNQVTDGDLGLVVAMMWIDGYFMTTDGNNLIVTELNNPYSVNPLKYGSSEVNPDPILGIINLFDEAYALNRYTIEVFDNIGGNFFPFQRVKGALLERGPVGTHAATKFMQAIAFVGSGFNESNSVWLGKNGQMAKLGTREVDQILLNYTDAQLATVVIEARVDKGHQHLLVHLPDQTLVYDGAASAVVEEPVWFSLTSSIQGLGTYRAKNLVWCYNKWLSEDPTSVNFGYYVDTVSSHYDSVNGWDFGTSILYNEGRGAIIHELELVTLPGRAAFGADPVIWTSYSTDGEKWSQEKPAKAGKQGQTDKRIHWLGQGAMRNWRIQKFRGTSDSHLSMARLEARVEALNV